jgi:Dual specificity phosphatase, catalytic domain
VDWITERIAIGNFLEAQDPALLRQHGVRSVLSLDGTLSPADAPRLCVDVVAAFRLIDGAGNDPRVFWRAVESLGELVRSHPPVLVHCHAGRSRSVVVVAEHLAKTLGIDPEDAVARVTAKREVNVTGVLGELLYES